MTSSSLGSSKDPPLMSVRCRFETPTTHGSISTTRDVLDPGVLEDLLGDRAVAPADDQHLADTAMRQDRHVGQHLVIDVLVRGGELDHVVEHHERPERDAFGDHEVLPAGTAVEQRPRHLDRGAVAVVQGLGVPAPAAGFRVVRCAAIHPVLPIASQAPRILARREPGVSAGRGRRVRALPRSPRSRAAGDRGWPGSCRARSYASGVRNQRPRS